MGKAMLISIGKNAFPLIGGLMVGLSCPWQYTWEWISLGTGVSLIIISAICLKTYFRLLKEYRWPRPR